MKLIGNDWDNILSNEFESEYYANLRDFLNVEYSSKVIYPLPKFIYTALKLTTYKRKNGGISGKRRKYRRRNQKRNGVCAHSI